mmetsp:Transcript_1329/g.3173  ORF Transcript_1329/g.3173 Transcript_1329/m.3173 type:complete len:222 (+) Transcript_1329:1131-1796(+)
MEENGLHLVLHHSRSNLPHNFDVRLAAYPVSIPQHCFLLLRLDNSSLEHRCVQDLLVDLVRFDAFKGSRNALTLAVSVDARVEVDSRRLELSHKSTDLVHVAHLLCLVLLLEVLERRDLAHKDGILFGQPGHKEIRSSCARVHSAHAVRLRDSEKVVEVGVLPENGLVVAVAPARVVEPPEQREGGLRLPAHQLHKPLPVLRVQGGGNLERLLSHPKMRWA